MAYVEIAKKKQAQRQAAIPKEWLLQNLPNPEVLDVSEFASTCGLLSKTEIEIIHTAAPKLVQNLRTGKLKSYDVTLAFSKAAAVAHQVVNPLTEIFFDKGLERAKQIDKEFERTKRPVGLLHGLPISIKDCFAIKGYDTTIGFAKFAFDPAKEQSVLIDILEEQGAVLYCKTNIPYGMLNADTSNHTYGQTKNPYNRLLGPGGSSGGEGALLAMRGSPLGVGTDIGGSIRIPSAFNYLYGLKPSSHRIPIYGNRTGLPGQEAIPSVAGPMANDLESLELFCKVVIGSKPWLRDPKCLNMPWDENVQIPTKLVIGVIESDNICRPTPPVANAIESTVNLLKAAGHTIVPITTPPHENLASFALKLFTAGGPEPLEQNFTPTGEEWPSYLAYMKHTKAIEVPEMWQIQAERTKWVKSVLDLWADTAKANPTERPIDCILSPVSPFAAPPIGKNSHMLYTMAWNIAENACGVFPVCRVTKENAKLSSSFKPMNDVEKKVYDAYDPELSLGAPVSLQIICQKYEDEKVLKILNVMANLKQNSRLSAKI